jgi:N-acetylneuraminic acid mutarotase
MGRSGIQSRSHHSCAFSDPYLYIYGGYDGNTATSLSTVHRIHSLTEESEEIFGQDEDFERCGHSAVIRHNIMITFGGYTRLYHNDLRTFDLSTRKWSEISPRTDHLPPKRWCHTSNLSQNYDKIYIFGGFSETKLRKNQNCSLVFSLTHL